MSADAEIVIVGGGVIGMACAHELASAGRRVRVIDRSTIGAGASSGNAGWVTMSQCFPVPSPGSVRTAIRSIGHADSPLYVRPSLSLPFVRWLADFRRFCTTVAFERGAEALALLGENAAAAYESWQAEGVATTFSRPGLLHAFLSEDEAARTMTLQRAVAHGRFDLPERGLTGDEITGLEPALQGRDVRHAYLVPGEGLVDPQDLLAQLRIRCEKLGVTICEGRTVTGFDRDKRRVRAVTVDGAPIDCSAIVIAAGTWSGSMLQRLGVPVRMQAGKGYSFSVEIAVPPRHPLYLGDNHVAVSPIGDTTRIAGTMEFSGDNLRLDWRRIEAIARASTHYLGPWFASTDELIGRIKDPWVGGRPMLPDGLPLIDRLPGVDNAYVATAHGMLGVTLAPTTASLLSKLITTGEKTKVLEPFGFQRSRPGLTANG